MRKTLRILATISLLTVGFLGASCNKNEADEPATRPQTGGVQEVTTGTGVLEGISLIPIPVFSMSVLATITGELLPPYLPILEERCM